MADFLRARLSVIGLGKLGAPMAAVFGAKGFDVVGVDLNASFVDAINSGKSPVVEPQLQEYLTRAAGRVRATTNYADAVHSTDVTFIIVPTPSIADQTFTNKYVIDAIEKIGSALRTKNDYHVVVVTSTIMPGSMSGEILAALESSSGRTVGPKLGLCYNPEFIALGSVIRDMVYPDMILIGESDKRAGDVLELIYRDSTESNPEYLRMNWVNAELCKLSINTFVTTKISYANMIADMCDHIPGADATVVAHALGADSRIGRKYLKPAIGYGGPCFPRDNKAFAALGRKLGVKCDLAEATDLINNYQLDRLFRAVQSSGLNRKQITILGLSYKPHTHVIEESQGITLSCRLVEAGCHVTVYDPMANAGGAAVLGKHVAIASSAQDAIKKSDVVVVMTPWPEFKTISWGAGLTEDMRRVVIDPWGIVEIIAGGSVHLARFGRGKKDNVNSKQESAA